MFYLCFTCNHGLSAGKSIQSETVT